MVYVCVICMCTSSLESLSVEHREILECLVSTSVNLVELHNVKLLVCKSCVSLIKALVKFKQTAIEGVTHVLHLWSKQKKVFKKVTEEQADRVRAVDSLYTLFKLKMFKSDEDSVKDELLREPEFAMKLVPEFVNLQDDIKPEQDMLQSETSQNWDNIEEAIPKSTIHVSNTNTGVLIVQNNDNNNNDNNTRITEDPLLHPTKKTAVFTHSKTSHCMSEPKMPTISTKVVTDTPRQVRVVMQNCFKKPQDSSRLMDPNLPQFLPYYNKLNKNNSSPAVQNLLSKLKATNIATHPVTVKKVAVRNIKLSGNKVLKEVNIGEIKNMLAKVRALKIAQIVTAKRAGEINLKPRSNSEQQLEEVIIEPRWCTRVFPYRKMIMARAKERTRPEFADAPHKCVSCVLVFCSQEETDEHSEKHVIGSDELPCKVCALPIRPCNEAAHDNTHMTRHVCARCTFSTEHLNVIEAHDCSDKPAKSIKKKRDYPVKCKICCSRLATEPALVRHIARRHSDPDSLFKCNVCSKQFLTRQRLTIHITRVHEKHKDSKDGFDPNRPELFCADCNVSFISVSGYRRHRLTLRHTSKDNWAFECDTCHQKFQTKSQLKLHIQAKHMVTKVSKCKECGKSYTDPNTFSRHMRYHRSRLRERPPQYVCDVCGKAFIIKKTLTEHLFMHSGLRPYKCKECPDTFTYSAALFTHIRLKHLKIKRNEKKKSKKDKQ